MKPLLQVTDLTIGKPSGPPIVDHVSFSISKGECFGIVGESGSGKSLTASAIGGLLPQELGVHSGELLLDGQPIDTSTDKGRRQLLRDKLGFIFQNPFTTLNPRLTVYDHLREALPREGNDRMAAQALLNAVGIPSYSRLLDVFPHQLSGGLSQRVMIATAIARKPSLLIADEPTTALDVTVQAKVLDLLDDIRSRTGVAVLLITHDIGIIKDRCDRLAVMKAGRILESGPVEQVIAHPSSDYTRRLLDAHPSNLSLSTPNIVTSDTVVLEAKGVSQSYGRRQVLSPTDFAVHRGQSVGIVGESGSGKTTLARILSGLVSPIEGVVQIRIGDNTREIRNAADRASLWQNVQYVFQNTSGTFDPRLSVEKVLKLALGGRGQGKDIEALLRTVELDPQLASRLPSSLSGGQRQRLTIARALARNPKVLIADEPVSALDQTVQAQILKLLARLRAERGMSLVLISHDLEVVRSLCDDVLVMTEGEIIERGSAAAIFDAPAKPYTQELIAAIPGARKASPNISFSEKVS
ncbi:ATP-binding cassette domain-containing protein [Aliirhizobium cellulosilyticum]|uniref:Peptide/nickel transport system ATP-binding protein n=1 Tax=Aliirhizobium cellulosilyticum TaxID=393664 RepID=A0A7W6XAB2_9HYPH|nr:ABC transporter ATP-binding protein [Rhizobium cellulosilyticum]MBB4349311.1 peptide/nickel transport system ATP-binding protein [Rhizobium cellulosilyticum]MBB4412467.1 peptide/nickel transport system ATP-binding protein [Rhizobium cellulosilyticum]MBB4447099.1 peptide/nickel transport system ATP-binding protein [Rhizobium cellulosilyticum]